MSKDVQISPQKVDELIRLNWPNKKNYPDPQSIAEFLTLARQPHQGNLKKITSVHETPKLGRDFVDSLDHHLSYLKSLLSDARSYESGLNLNSIEITEYISGFEQNILLIEGTVKEVLKVIDYCEGIKSTAKIKHRKDPATFISDRIKADWVSVGEKAPASANMLDPLCGFVHGALDLIGIHLSRETVSARLRGRRP